MKQLKLITFLCFTFLFLHTHLMYSQKRIKPPKKESKIDRVDLFVNKTFEVYNTVFTFDSLTSKGIEIHDKYEDAFIEKTQKDAELLYELIPEMVEEASEASVLKQAKATANLNKARKAMTFCVKFFKDYILE